jgi:signal transduction histidine kinase/DNA-binding response OmpR family regulator/ligand-binding sensor domain-containing protein
MWFGTKDGLNQYDGSNISSYKPISHDPSSLSDNYIRSIVEDKQQNLWITTDNGVNRFNYASKSFTRFFSDGEFDKFYKYKLKTALCADTNLLCLRYGNGIYKYDYEDAKFDFVDIENLDLHKTSVNLFFNSKNDLYLFSDNNLLYKLKKEKEKWFDVACFDLRKIRGAEFSKFWHYELEGVTYLLFSDIDGGVFVLNLSNFETQELHFSTGGSLSSILKEEGKNEFFAGCECGAVYKIVFEKGKFVFSQTNDFEDLKLDKIKILCTFQSDSMFWFGTDGNGVHQYLLNSNNFFSIKKGTIEDGNLNHSIVKSVIEDQYSNIWAGTAGGGINIIDKNLGKNTVYDTKNGLNSNYILCLYEDQNKNIWIGSESRGVQMFDVKQRKFYTFPDDFIPKTKLNFSNVQTICQDVYGTFWLGTFNNGLIKLNIKKSKTGKYLLNSYRFYTNDFFSKNKFFRNSIKVVKEGAPNIIWIGTNGRGLYRMNTLTDEYELFMSNEEDENSLINNDVICICKSKTNDLWVGTTGGLNKINLNTKPYTFISYTDKQMYGLLNNSVHSIQEDKNYNIWISTNKGLTKISPHITTENSLRHYLTSDGLQSNEYCDGASFLNNENGRIYFGGIKGVDFFNPTEIKETTEFPSLEVTDISLTNVSQEENKQFQSEIKSFNSVEFDYDQNFFQCSFTTLDYANKEKCKYRYILEGFDNNYTYTTSGVAKFTNVPDGSYVLKINNTNSDGVWNAQEKLVNIQINPPFWSTVWANIIYLMILIVITDFIVKKYFVRIKSVSQEQLDKLENKKTNEINQYKFQFFTNIAHEFKTPLTLIMAPASQLMKIVEKDDKLYAYAKYIYKNSLKLQDLIKELIDYRKLETGFYKLNVRSQNVSKIIYEAFDNFSLYASKNKIHLDIKKGNEPLHGFVDRNILEKVVTNLISNAIKYTPENGSVQIEEKYEKGRLVLSITDTGVGIDDDVKNKIFQRFYHKSSSINKNIPEGTGIGLALTKSLVMLHKGTIKILNTENVGTCFEVVIPIAETFYTQKEKYQGDVHPESIFISEIESVINKEEEEGASVKQKYSPSSKTILVVDDEPQIREMLESLLARNYRVLKASNGKEALKIVGSKKVNLIISDVIMPEMNGYELCKAVKDNIQTCHIAVVLLTAKTELESRLQGLETGADCYMPKPFEPVHLDIRIRKLLEHQEKITVRLQNSPEQPVDIKIGVNSKDAKLLNDLQVYVEENMSNYELDADMLAEHLAMSKPQIYRKIKAITDLTPHAYIKQYRLKKAAQLLLENELTVSEIIFEIGFNNRTYFYRSFKETYGCSPLDYVKIERDRLSKKS